MGGRPDASGVPRLYNFIIAFRKQHPALLRGATLWVHNSDEAHVITFLRRTAGEELLITVNLGNTPFVGMVEADGNWEEIPFPSERAHHNTGEPDQAEADAATVALPALALKASGFRIFQRSLVPAGVSRQAK